jgi:hypothetical protein
MKFDLTYRKAAYALFMHHELYPSVVFFVLRTHANAEQYPSSIQNSVFAAHCAKYEHCFASSLSGGVNNFSPIEHEEVEHPPSSLSTHSTISACFDGHGM